MEFYRDLFQPYLAPSTPTCLTAARFNTITQRRSLGDASLSSFWRCCLVYMFFILLLVILFNLV